VAIDARDAARFSGARTFIDNRAGHIPGARSAPGTEVLDGGRIRGAAELRAHYARLGIDESTDVIAYCGSGVSACLNVLALERAGLPTPRLYVASWSGWSADPQNPAELGA
jgi:thiosulfate/3-mercaptopyruvate sulfurtransferase